MNRFLPQAAFAAGLIAVGWVGAGYLGTNPVALAVTALIGAFYGMGALELWRFRQATAALDRALAALTEAPPALAPWLAQLPPALQQPVRLRVEGLRVGLPGPALTPYLTGLLVLLGMLGTFLGMVVTLQGTGLALESTTDLGAIRASLAAPVRGLGLAFGTSLAGVAASAMLGLVSALSRRDRLLAAQRLDQQAATTLRGFSPAHQREQAFEALQHQARLLPALVDGVQALAAQLAQQQQALHERLLAGQQDFHQRTEAAFDGLARAVDQSLRHSLTESARIAGATIQPAVEATMAGIARETSALQAQVAGTLQQQLDGLSARFDGAVGTVTAGWTRALARHERSSEALTQGLDAALERFGHTFEQRSAALLGTLAERQAAQQAGLAAAAAELQRDAAAQQERLAETVTRQFDSVSARLDGAVDRVAANWQDALAEHRQGSAQLTAEAQRAWTASAAGFAEHAAGLAATVDRALAGLQAELAARDDQRLAAWTASLAAVSDTLQQAWQQAGAQALDQQQQLCGTLAQTARDIAQQAETQTTRTVAETSRLMQAAAEAPRAAAEVIAQLRQQLADSLARDNGVLEERGHLMATLATLLDTVRHAATEQRGAIDALVAASSSLLAQVGSRFDRQVDDSAARIADAAAQLGGSAAEVASLGEAFGLGVQLFSDASSQLAEHLQRLEATLGQSVARSDEQLAYYVAQAREIIDLSLVSQRQIVEDLQRLAPGRPAALASEAR